MGRQSGMSGGDDDARSHVEMEDELLTLDTDYDTRPGLETRLWLQYRSRTKRQAQRLLRLLLAAVGFCTRSRQVDYDRPLQSILVVRVDLLGDVVLSLPAVRALRRRFPEARIDMLVQKSSAAILDGHPDIDKVLAYDPHIWRQPTTYLRPSQWHNALQILRTLREARYDLAISISGDMGSILTRLSGARRRIGYAREAYRFFLTDPVPGGRYRIRQHETEYTLALARAAGADTEEADARPRLACSPAASERVTAMLHNARSTLGHAGPLIALHGGARNGQAKRWPTGHFARLAERLTVEMDALVVLTGAKNEALLAEAIQRQCRSRLINLVGKTSLPELVALLAASDLVISGDSGPMHIASAVDTPLIALHGPTDPALSGPTSPFAVVLRRDLWCSPCYNASATAECPFGNPVCMKGLSPDLVFATAREQLRRYGRDGRYGSDRSSAAPASEWTPYATPTPSP